MIFCTVLTVVVQVKWCWWSFWMAKLLKTLHTNTGRLLTQCFLKTFLTSSSCAGWPHIIILFQPYSQMTGKITCSQTTNQVSFIKSYDQVQSNYNKPGYNAFVAFSLTVLKRLPKTRYHNNTVLLRVLFFCHIMSQSNKALSFDIATMETFVKAMLNSKYTVIKS